MIVTVTLNPAVDISYKVNHFQIGHGHRVEAGRKTAGGKGLNVSRVLKKLGETPICTGFLGGHNGEWIEDQLKQEKLDHAFIAIAEETRTCLAFLDEEQGTQTELMERGPVISAEKQEEFEAIFKELLGEASFVIASGSLASGIPNTYYRDICEWAHAAHIPVLLDTSGEALKEGIAGKPFLIKPNQEELSQYMNLPQLSFESQVDAAKAICARGVKYVLLSLGKDGAILVEEGRVLRAELPAVKVVNPVGSGDSMIAGMAYALQRGYPLAECLKWACASGTANAMEPETGMIQPQIVRELVARINVHEEI
ncbi:1-phosphofructokinase [Lederbergia sp. NSJ-179]|uniref:1-phosphofructokinase n=1 Tax=Lederbergia sp. NSJ-179 TaxID=2931402 RepID=UPI001FD481C6|nr:1-phosphofructokinase [Lederbergia sp. NSJ-179]MCJ7841544.1 1-phosphofructokinase [Lederbergia sp. NSJ-179]